MKQPSVRRKRRKIRPGRVVPPGTPPGTLSIDPNAPKPSIQLLAYGPDGFTEHTIETVETIREYLGKSPVTWVNVDGLGDAETIQQIATIFGIHRLAIEDVAHVHQRSKVEPYPEHLFVVAQMVDRTDRLNTEQLSLFLGRNFVLTFQEAPGDCFEPIRQRIRKGAGRLRNAGADYLAYALLDSVIDCYFPLLEDYGESMENLEEEIARRANYETLTRLHETKRDLLTLRRAIWPQRESINFLTREPISFITNETRIYLRDCYDHTVEIIDIVETMRELCSDLSDLYVSSVSNRLNEIMKVLTIIATIFMPLSFIASLYGMNFNTEKSSLNMPELNWYWGYPFALGLMGIVAIGLTIYFWRKGWFCARLNPREVTKFTKWRTTGRNRYNSEH